MRIRRNDGRPKLGISGSYGGLNLGDEAILQAMIAQLRASLPLEITVLSRNAADTQRRHDVDHVADVRELSRAQAKCLVEALDLLILGGGGLLYDAEAEIYLREVQLALELGVPVMLYAISAGPLQQPSVRALLRDTLNQVALITVRDRRSRQLLEDLGVTREILVTADPAVLLQPDPLTLEEILRAEAIDPSARLIGMSVREPGPAAPDLDTEHYHLLMANAADYMVARLDAELVFFPLERRSHDVQHSHGVVSRMRHAQSATVLKREYSCGQLVSLLQHFQFAVGMRLHFLIFSALAGVPFVALPYATKVQGFLEELEIDYPALENVSAGQLIATLDRAWDRRDELRVRMRNGLARLQERARENNTLALQLLGQGGDHAGHGASDAGAAHGA